MKAERSRLPPAERTGLIIDEALRLFAERHFAAVSVREVADACGINVGLLYYYFKDKDELLRRVLAHAIQALQAEYGQAKGEHSTPRETLFAWFKLHIPIASLITRMVKIMSDFAASPNRDVETDKLIQAFYEEEQGFLEQTIQAGITSGIFRCDDIPQAARVISLQMDGIFYASLARGDHQIERDIESLCYTVDRLLCA
jgi:AcrR family transcriptional regulator